MEIKEIALEFELTKEAVERGPFITGGCKISDGVEAGLKEAVIAIIIGVKATNPRMLFEDQNIGIEACETNSGGQSRKTAADYYKRGRHLVRRLSAGAPGS